MQYFLKQSVLAAFVLFGLGIGLNSFSPKTSAADNSETIDAAALYKKRCATCHGKDGRAKNFRGKIMHATNLTDADWQNDVTDEHIFNAISDGKKDMPAFKKRLSVEEINSLVTYIRGLKK